MFFKAIRGTRLSKLYSRSILVIVLFDLPFKLNEVHLPTDF